MLLKSLSVWLHPKYGLCLFVYQFMCVCRVSCVMYTDYTSSDLYVMYVCACVLLFLFSFFFKKNHSLNVTTIKTYKKNHIYQQCFVFKLCSSSSTPTATTQNLFYIHFLRLLSHSISTDFYFFLLLLFFLVFIRAQIATP